MGDLLKCEDAAVWRQVCENYREVLQAKGKKPDKLQALDEWFQEELPAVIAGRRERFITQAELVKLMEWKLTRGKFRPRLQQLVASNSEETVQRCSTKAFSLLPDVPAALAELSSLKAVGPATASAVLAAAAPDMAAFMSDEAVESFAQLRPVKYTAGHYLLYLGKMVELSQKLNAVDPRQDWTPHRLELCLWAWAWATRLQLPLVGEVKITGGHEAKTRSDGEKRPRKKQRTT